MSYLSESKGFFHFYKELLKDYVTLVTTSSKYEDVFTPEYLENLTFSELESLVLRINPNHRDYCVYSAGVVITAFISNWGDTDNGQDIREDNTKRMLDLLYQYQVRYILDDLEQNYSTASESSYDIAHTEGIDTVAVVTTGTYSLDVVASKLTRDLKKLANVIEKVSGRMEGNRIVCGTNLKTFLESLPNTFFTPTPDANTGKYGFSAPREIGTFGTFKIYYDPTVGNTEAWMTYRGEEWYDSSYIMGEYLPVIPSDCVNIQVQVKSAFYSMEAYYFQKPQCVLPFTVTLS